MARFFQVQADERVKSLTHSTRLSKADRAELTSTFGTAPVRVFAVKSAHAKLAQYAHQGLVTSRTLSSLGVKSKGTDSSLLRYTMGEAVVYLDEEHHRFYAPQKVLSAFLQSLTERAEKLLLPPKKERKKMPPKKVVKSTKKANVTQQTRNAVDRAMRGWEGNAVDRRALEHALQVHAELIRAQALRDSSWLPVALDSDSQGAKRLAPHLHKAYVRMCRSVQKHMTDSVSVAPTLLAQKDNTMATEKNRNGATPPKQPHPSRFPAFWLERANRMAADAKRDTAKYSRAWHAAKVHEYYARYKAAVLSGDMTLAAKHCAAAYEHSELGGGTPVPIMNEHDGGKSGTEGPDNMATKAELNAAAALVRTAQKLLAFSGPLRKGPSSSEDDSEGSSEDPNDPRPSPSQMYHQIAAEVDEVGLRVGGGFLNAKGIGGSLARAYLSLTPKGKYPNGCMSIDYSSRLQPYSYPEWQSWRPEPKIGTIPQKAATRVYALHDKVEKIIKKWVQYNGKPGRNPKTWKVDYTRIKADLKIIAPLLKEAAVLMNETYVGKKTK